jgi:hypothetical protein
MEAFSRRCLDAALQTSSVSLNLSRYVRLQYALNQTAKEGVRVFDGNDYHLIIIVCLVFKYGSDDAKRRHG